MRIDIDTLTIIETYLTLSEYLFGYYLSYYSMIYKERLLLLLANSLEKNNKD